MDYLVIVILGVSIYFVVRRLVKNKSACSSCAKSDCHLCSVNVYDEYMKDKQKLQEM